MAGEFKLAGHLLLNHRGLDVDGHAFDAGEAVEQGFRLRVG